MTHVILSLNDGETFSHVDGCSLIFISSEGLRRIENGETIDQAADEIIQRIEFNHYPLNRR